MDDILPKAILWWVVAVDVPLLLMFGRLWQRLRQELSHMRTQTHEAVTQLRLELVKDYASTSELRETETRLISHLLRLETKLDHTNTRAQAAYWRDRHLEKMTHETMS